MLNTIFSAFGVPVRLTDERWAHIVEEHNELAGMLHDVLETVAAPERVVRGNAGECLALKSSSAGKYLVVVYKEDAIKKDGFVITAFLTRRMRSIDRRPQLWP